MQYSPTNEAHRLKIVHAIQLSCAALSERVSISTADLVNRLWPDDDELRKQAFSVLAHPPAALDGYWTRGLPVRGRFGVKRPNLWHRPKPPCPHCHGTGLLQSMAAEPVLDDSDDDEVGPLTAEEAAEVLAIVKAREAGTALAPPDSEIWEV